MITDEKTRALYEVFKTQLIEDGFIEANPKRWVRPERHIVNAHFCDKHPAVLEHHRYEEADKFWDYYESIDWYTKGKVRIKSWKGRANTWIKNNEKYKKSDSGKARKLSVAEQVAANIAARADEDTTQPEMFGSVVVDHG